MVILRSSVRYAVAEATVAAITLGRDLSKSRSAATDVALLGQSSPMFREQADLATAVWEAWKLAEWVCHRALNVPPETDLTLKVVRATVFAHHLQRPRSPDRQVVLRRRLGVGQSDELALIDFAKRAEEYDNYVLNFFG